MKKIIVAIALLAVLMFAEYRFIMCNLSPYTGAGNTIYIEFMGQVDAYDDALVPIEEVE